MIARRDTMPLLDPLDATHTAAIQAIARIRERAATAHATVAAWEPAPCPPATPPANRIGLPA